MILTPRTAQAYREVIGDLPPGWRVADPDSLDARDITIRPGIVERMRAAEQARRTAAIMKGHRTT